MRLSFTLLFALPAASCRQTDPGVEEKLARATAEMDSLRADLATAHTQVESLKKELEKSSSAQRPSSTTVAPTNTGAYKPLPIEQLEEGYIAAARVLRRKLETELKDFTIKGYTFERVRVAPEVATPYTSKIGIEFLRPDGQTFKVELDAAADFSGVWTFPSHQTIREEITRGLTAPIQPTAPPVTAQQGNSSAPTQQVPSLMPNSGTVRIDWGDAAQRPQPQPPQTPPASSGVQFDMPPPAAVPPNAGYQPPAPPSAPPAQAPPAGDPVKVMPTDRDVLIQF